MISEFKHIEQLFKEIDTHLTQKVHIFVIGGAVLLYHGLKPATKDIDIIVDNSSHFTALEKGLTIPIMPEINKLREEYFKEFEKRIGS